MNRGMKTAAGPGGAADIGGLVDSIRKHKKFKQLASYSIQCLEKVVCPPYVGWEKNVRAAFELGAAGEIADTCLRFAVDPEIFTMCVASLRSIATVPKAVAAMAASTAAGHLVSAVQANLAGLLSDGLSVEGLTRLAPALELLLQFARTDGATFHAAGGIAMLLGVASTPMPPAAAGGAGGPASPGSPGGPRSPSKSGSGGAGGGINVALLAAYSAMVGLAATILERASRANRVCLDALSGANLPALIAMATLDLTPGGAGGSADDGAGGVGGSGRWGSVRKAMVAKRALSMMAMTTSPGGGGGAGSSARGGALLAAAAASSASAGGAGAASGSGRDFNPHLEPAFRILDRLARSDDGRDALLGAGATKSLSASLTLVGRHRQLEALVMRVLGRLLGSNIAELVERIGGGDAVDLRERVLCARLLASMSRDDDYVAALVAGEGSPLLARVLALACAPPLVDTDACVALLQVLRRVADSAHQLLGGDAGGSSGATSLTDTLTALNAVPSVVSVLAAREGHAPTVAEAVGFLAAMIDSPDAAAAMGGSAAAAQQPADSGLQLALQAFSLHAGSEAVALSCLELVERCIFHDVPSELLVGTGPHGLIAVTLRAMADLPDSMPVQLLGTDVLVYLADAGERVGAMTDAGALPVLIRNLRTLGGASRADGGAGYGGEAADEPAAGADSSDAAAGRLSESAEGADADAGAASAAAAAASSSSLRSHALSAQLVASSLYLVTSLCAVEDVIPAAKAAGVIRAVLAGFSKHSTDPAVYRNFRDVISALAIEEAEVTGALASVMRHSARLQAVFSDDAGVSSALKPVNEYLARTAAYGAVALPGSDAPASSSPTEADRRDPTALADAILEGISLLEAVTVAPVFVCTIAAHGGVPVLLRALGVLSAVRHVSRAAAAAKAAAGGKPAAGAGARGALVAGAAAGAAGGARGVAVAVAEEVLARTCNTLAHMARVAYEIEGGQVESDPDYPDFDASAFGVSELMHDRDTLELVARAMQACAKPHLRQFALASVTLLSWLASGHTHALVREHVEGIVAAQGIEACVAILRAHQGSLQVCSATAGALTRIAVAAKGATAVATRGGSRQIIRMLHPTAALRTQPGDELLLSLLRLMDTCAGGGPESAEILRRQGLVDAVVACADAGTALDFAAAAGHHAYDGGLGGAGGGDEGDAPGGGSSGKPVAGGKAAAHAGKAPAAATHHSHHQHSHHAYAPDPLTRADIDATITSIFSRLVGPELVRDTVAHLQTAARELRAQVTAGYHPRAHLALPASHAPGSLTRAIVRLGLLATTQAGTAAGAEALEAGAAACVAIADAAVAVARAAAGAGFSHLADVGGQVEAELEPALPTAIRTLRLVTSVLFAGGPGSGPPAAGGAGSGVASAVAAIPVLFATLAERPDCAGEVVAATALLSLALPAVVAIPTAAGGDGLAVLCGVLREAGDRGHEGTARDALLTLAAVAAIPDQVARVVAAGAHSAAEAWLVDAVNDASPDALAGAFLVLAHVCSVPAVRTELLRGPLFDLARIALSAHCADPYAPREPLLRAVALLLARLAADPAVVDDVRGAGEDFRATLRRVLKAGAGSTGYLDSPRCAVALLDAITAACDGSAGSSGGAALPERVRAANKEAAVSADGEELIVQCMSSSSADEVVLASGAAALVAIGAGDRAARLVADIDAYAQRIPEWLDAGYAASAPSVIDLVHGMSDAMRNLASALVGRAGSGGGGAGGGPPPDLGTPYADVLATIWRAVAVLCRDDMASVRATDAAPQPYGEVCGKDLHAVRADCLAVGAQITGRLAAASAAAGGRGVHSVPLGDLVSVLYTILAAAHSVLEVRVVESLGRAADLVSESRGDEATRAMCRGKVIAGLISLLQVIQDEDAKARLASAGGGLGGLDAQAFLALPDVARCETTVTASIRAIVGKVRSTLTGATSGGASAAAAAASSQLLGDAESLADIALAAAITSAPSLASQQQQQLAAAGGGDDEAGGAADGSAAASSPSSPSSLLPVDEPAGSELALLCDAIAERSLPAGWGLLDRVARKVSDAMSGPARRAAKGAAPVYTVATLQADVRTQGCLLRALQPRALPPVPPTDQTVTSLLCSLTACLDVGLDASGKGRSRAAAGQLPAAPSQRGGAGAADADAGGNAPGDDANGDDDNDDAGGDDCYAGTEAEAATAASLFALAAAVSSGALRGTLELLARCDLGPSGPCGTSALATDASLTSSLAFLVSSRRALDAGACGGALSVLARLSDVAEGAKLVAPAASAARCSRLSTLGAAGVYRFAVASLALPGIGDALPHVTETVTVVSRVLHAGGGGVSVQALGLDKQCLQALQATAKRYSDSQEVATAIAPLIAALEEVYTEQSGAAFEALARRVLETLRGCASHQRHLTADGQLFYSNTAGGGNETTWEAPPPLTAFTDALLALDSMARKLEDEAVPAVEPTVCAGLVGALREHEHDRGVSGVLLAALGKLAANGDNHGPLEQAGAMQAAVAAIVNSAAAGEGDGSGHIADPRCCEGFAALALPLSFDPEFVRSVLADADVIPQLVAIIRAYTQHTASYFGSPLGWLPENAPDYNARVDALLAEGPEAEERNRRTHRLAQTCVQCLANLACDNEPNPASGTSSVTRIVECGGIEALGELMSAHAANPRMLEDAICALSNMAFVSDGIQLSIGRSCMDSVCAAATSFNGDSYLFQMTLRAIGNLTRCDENIMRAVGFGVIRGMVEGMAKHGDDPAVLQLCADVIGNMASVDDRKVPRDEGMRILRDCSAKRTNFAPLIPAPPPKPKGSAGGSGGLASPAPAARTLQRQASAQWASASTQLGAGAAGGAPAGGAVAGLSADRLVAVLAGSKSLKEAVCAILYEDGGARALVAAMTAHIRAPDLAGSCLRALHYIGASSELVTRMTAELRLVDQVVYIMRSIDYRADVLRRGARVLGLVVGTEQRSRTPDGKDVVTYPLRERVLEAGAPAVLLGAIETHSAQRDLAISCYSVLAMARSPALVTAVIEMGAIDTATSVLRANAGDGEYVGVLLELLWGWAGERELAQAIAARSTPVLAALMMSFAQAPAQQQGDGERLQHLNYLLNLGVALVRQRVAPEPLLQGGLISGLQAVVGAVLARADGSALLPQRPLVLQAATILQDIVRPPVGPAGGAPRDPAAPPPPVNVHIVAPLLECGVGPLLERILHTYKAVPDPKNPRQLLLDQSMCTRVKHVLDDLVAVGGYVPSRPVSFDPEDGSAVAGGGGGAADAAGAGNLAPRPPPPRNPAPPEKPRGGGSASSSSGPEPLDAAQMLAALRSGGRVFEVWHSGGAARRARVLIVGAGGGAVVAHFDEGDSESFPLSGLRVVNEGVYAGFKRRMMGRNPKPALCVSLEQAAHHGGALLMLLETGSELTRHVLAQAFQQATGAVLKVTS